MFKKIFTMAIVCFSASALFAVDAVTYNHHTEIKLFPNAYGITSLRLEIQNYLPRMAHPSHEVETINVDTRTQRILHFSDLFSNEQEALRIVANYARAYYIKKLHQEDDLPAENFNARLEMIRSGTAAMLENYRHWNVIPGYLQIVFERAQVAPSYFGEETLDIPLSLLQNVLNKKLFPNYKD